MSKKQQQQLALAGGGSLAYLMATDDPLGVYPMLGDAAPFAFYGATAALVYGLSGSTFAAAVVAGGLYLWDQQQVEAGDGLGDLNPTPCGGAGEEPCPDFGGVPA